MTMYRTLNLPLPRQKSAVSAFVIWLVTLSGMAGIYLGLADWFLPKTPFNLLVGAGLLIWNFPLKNGWRSLLVWSLAFGIGVGVEMLGVNFGLLFGEYRYGENLGPKVLGVPLLIGINWVVLTFLTGYLARRLFRSDWLALPGAAALMVGLDFFIEPTAPLFDFWHWTHGAAPLQNYVAWFGVALVMQLLVRKEITDREDPLPLHHFASQVVFFAFFYAIYHL